MIRWLLLQIKLSYVNLKIRYSRVQQHGLQCNCNLGLHCSLCKLKNEEDILPVVKGCKIRPGLALTAALCMVTSAPLKERGM
jgi:hypothetical protein